MSEMKVPEGYKQTEIGVIPEDWEVTTIGNFAPLQRGFDLPTTKVEAGDYPVVYSNGIVRNHKTFQVKGAGIVTGRSGTIGKVHYIENDFWPHNTTLWVTSFGDAHVKFVYYLFKYIGFERFKSGSGVPTLNRYDAHSFKITVPTKVDEQTAIATALSDVDNLIQSLEKLIAKKEAIKTGTMQQLLTGKTRLPEFATREDGSLKGFKQTELGRIPEDWEITTIGDFSPLQRGFDLPTTQVEAGEYPVVYSNGILRTHKAFQVNGAGIVTGRSGTIGKVHYVERDFWPHNTTLWVTSFGNSNVKFVYYLFNSIGFERFKSGSGVPTLNRNDAHSFKITVPIKVKEQTAIATILSDMDSEIQALQKRLDKTRDIKQGMMQQLLTGKVRLISSGSYSTHSSADNGDCLA